MKVKVINNKKEVKERPFPKLMQHRITKFIALFSNTETGIVLDPKTSSWKTGDITNRTSGADLDFIDFEGKIQLSND